MLANKLKTLKLLLIAVTRTIFILLKSIIVIKKIPVLRTIYKHEKKRKIFHIYTFISR